MTPRGVWELSTESLGRLDRYLATRTRSGNISILELDSEGFQGPAVADLDGLNVPAARAVVAALLGERTLHPRPDLELVWSGPESAGARSRETARVLDELFASAERTVVVAGFAFWKAREIFEPLHARAISHRLDIEFFVHFDATGENRAMTPEAFFRHSWPWTDVVPRVYHDRRISDTDAEASSMHAKCVVIDDLAVLITSANFTARAHDHNVELGALIRDSTFATTVARQWRSLVARGLFVPLSAPR